MNGIEYLATMLSAYRVTHVFYVPDIIPSALRPLSESGVRPIAAHGEKAAAYMADGYARLTRRPAVCMAQAVGSSNLAAGLKDAFHSCSPVVALTGGPDAASKYRHVYQEIRDYQMFEPVTKWNAEIETPARLPEIMRQAFRVATTGAPGPVHVELSGHQGQVALATESFDRIFETRFSATPAFRPQPEADSIAAALQLISEAERPIIIAGGGVTWSGAEGELAELAERLAVPVATSLHAKAAMADAHPLNVGVPGRYSRSCANRLVNEADVVLFVGSHTGSLVTHAWQLVRGDARVIQIDIDPAELGRHYPNTVSICGDAAVSLRQMALSARRHRNAAWREHAARLVQDWRREVGPRLHSEAVPIRPERLVFEIAEVLPDDAALVVDTLQVSYWAGAMLGLRGPSQRFLRCAGSMGWAFPAALGAQCADDRRVICLTGDGGFYYHIAELETAARHRIPLLVIVNNNSAYGCIGALYGDSRNEPPVAHGWRFAPVQLATVATSMGWEALTVDKPSAIAGALRRGLSMSRPTLIDVITDPDAVYDRAWTPTAM